MTDRPEPLEEDLTLRSLVLRARELGPQLAALKGEDVVTYVINLEREVRRIYDTASPRAAFDFLMYGAVLNQHVQNRFELEL